MQSDGRQTVRVDDALLGLCNDAYVRAARRGVREVGIADLAWCIASSSRWAREIELAGDTAARLLAAAAQAMAERGGISGASGGPRTADELKILLTRAESIADRLGRTCATPGDFIHVLLLEADDLSSAAFVRSSVGQASDVRSNVPAGPSLRTDARAGAWSREERELPGGVAVPKWRQSVPPDTREAVAPAPEMARRQRWPEPRETELRKRAKDYTGSAAIDLGPNVATERLSDYEIHLAPLQRQTGELAEQIAILTERLERLTERDPGGAVREIKAGISANEIAQRRESAGLESRIDAHERHLTELRRQIVALSHEAETLAARLAQALELGRTQATALARVEQFAGSAVATSGAGRSKRTRGGRANRKAARSRLRQIRRRHLRFRLRQRRRDRLRLLLRSDGRRISWSRRTMSLPAVDALPTAGDVRALAPVEAPVGQTSLVPRMSTLEATVDLDEDISEPIEDEDDLEPVGAFGERPKRFYLSLSDEVERAPSIGPRTAERLTAAGIVTVRDLLLCDPRDVASRVASRYVSVDRITAWKAQSRLVCTIPWLRGTHAQLLVGAGFESLESLVDADTSSVCAGILRFAGTREGQSVLRSTPAPAAERVGKWMEHVSLAEPERVRLAA